MDKRKWVAVLTEKEGGKHEKFFDRTKARAKYLKKHHDSVVAYRLFLVVGDQRFFSKEGTFKPRTKYEIARSKAKLRRKRKARRNARQAEELARRLAMPVDW